MLQRRLYLMNVPYDAYKREIEALVKEFVEIEEVVIPKDRTGRPRGYAFVYLKDAKDLDKAIDYIDGRHLKGRQIRVKKYLGEGFEKKDLKEEDLIDPQKTDEIVRYLRFMRNFILTKGVNHDFVSKREQNPSFYYMQVL